MVHKVKKIDLKLTRNLKKNNGTRTHCKQRYTSIVLDIFLLVLPDECILMCYILYLNVSFYLNYLI